MSYVADTDKYVSYVADIDISVICRRYREISVMCRRYREISVICRPYREISIVCLWLLSYYIFQNLYLERSFLTSESYLYTVLKIFLSESSETSHMTVLLSKG